MTDTAAYTKTPNEILDTMPEMGEAELRLTVVLVRLTYGYHCDEVRLTYKEMKEKAHLSQGGVANAITAIEKRGFFRRGARSMWYANSLPSRQKSIDKSLPSRQKSIDKSLPSRQFPINKEKEEKEKGEEPPPFPFQPSPVPLRETPADARVTAILEVCQMGANVPRHRQKAETAAAQIKDISAGYIRERYSRRSPPNGSWFWYRDDFRGRRGEAPSPEAIIDTIYKVRDTTVSDDRHYEDIISDAVDEVMENGFF